MRKLIASADGQLAPSPWMIGDERTTWSLEVRPPWVLRPQTGLLGDPEAN